MSSCSELIARDVCTADACPVSNTGVPADPRGEIIEGWPVGFYEYEFPRHKTLQDRLQMVSRAAQEMQCLREAHMVLVDSIDGDPFLNKFGAWPDQAFCLEPQVSHAGINGIHTGEHIGIKLKFRGEFVQETGEEMGGWRYGNSFVSRMEEVCF